MNVDARISFDYAQIGGVRLHYARAGDGDNLVILLHGFPECWYSWRHQLAALSDGYTVVAPDLRGYNLSDKPRSLEAYKLDVLADDVIGLIHHFGRRQAAVIGHDWGAAIAWRIGFEHPEYLTKLGALQVPPLQVWKRNITLRQVLASWYMLFFQLPWVPELVLSFRDHALLKRVLRRSTVEKDVFSEEDLAVYDKAWSEPGALTGMLSYHRANLFGRQILSAPSNKKITVPTLFIYGQQDFAILPETVRNAGEAVDAKFDEFFFPVSGHWVQQEAADAVTQVLREFLDD